MKDFNPASLKIASNQKLANSMTSCVPEATIRIVSATYVATITMTGWYILEFRLAYFSDGCRTRPHERKELPLPSQLNNCKVSYVSYRQIPSTPTKSISSLANKIKKCLSTQINYSTAYNNILGVVAKYNSYVDTSNRIGKKLKNSLLSKTRTSRYIPKCRGPVKNYKVKINSSMSGARDISADSNNLLSVLCESFPYLQKVISL